MTHARAQAGFTLMEILVALAVLALGTTGVFLLFNIGAQTHRRAIENARVAALADTLLTELNQGMSLGDPIDLRDATHPSFPDGFRYDATYVAVGPLDSRAYAVTVKIKWQRAGREASETFDTVMLRR
ncbi:MAG: prepilin-type N-terminal cleavage/methylation domain-containing protein [Planctomycetes bacterium]|nr:prepilin-type N-terminal cleavage/methylation domain-containing protein [Planctomycetota bacterium]